MAVWGRQVGQAPQALRSRGSHLYAVPLDVVVGLAIPGGTMDR